MRYMYLTLGILAASAVLLLALGTALQFGKAYWLLSGYNTMSKEKKKNVDAEGLAQFSARLCYGMAGIILLAALFLYLEQSVPAMLMFFALLPLSIYAIFKSQKYDGNTRNEDGSMKKSTKIMLGVFTGFMVIVAAAVGALLYFGSLPAEYWVGEDTLQITGMYGEKIAYEEIAAITLEEKMPELQYKTNGSDLGDIKKGYFSARDLGRVKLFLDDASRPPYIYVEAASGWRIMNKKDPVETEELYQKLSEAWSK